MLDRTLTGEEFEDLNEAEDSPTPVTYSTQDFDVSGLVQRLDRGSMLIPSFGAQDPRVDTAGFQRGFVWTKAQMDRFIESLLLGYPVPGIFLVKQEGNNRLLVLDGQQRLVTLQRFYAGIHAGREFALTHVGTEFRGLTYKSLDESLKYKLDDSYMQATIVTADGSREVNEAIYQIFERLNSGGTQLTPHEIRVALFAGPFVAYLEELNSDDGWRALYGRRSPRIRDQELVLRILALFLDVESYGRPLKRFLNVFVSSHRSNDEVVRTAGDLFRRACDAILAGPGASAFRRTNATQVNVAQTEAIMVGVMRALSNRSLIKDLAAAVDALRRDPRFDAATGRATADKDSVIERVRLATEAVGT